MRLNLDRLEDARARLRKLIAELRERFEVSRVILFGSFAHDEDVHEMSDIDLVIVGDLPGRLFDRIGVVLRMTDLPVEPWVYTPSEWAQMVAEGNAFVEEVIATGVDL